MGVERGPLAFETLGIRGLIRHLFETRPHPLLEARDPGARETPRPRGPRRRFATRHVLKPDLR